MVYMKATVLSLAALASASGEGLTAVTWGGDRVDVFGLTSDHSIWHKYDTPDGWKPDGGLEKFPSSAKSVPSVTAWGENRLDILYVNASGSNVLHKYWDGSQWGPSWDSAEDLAGDVESVASSSWGENRLDVIGKESDGSYVHKAWTGKGWYPEDGSWEDFGGNFSSTPAIYSSSEGHVDIVGISAEDGSIVQKYYQDGWSKWTSLGGGPFVGTPVLSSPSEGRIDIWAIDKSGQLNHKFWDGHDWQGWESLGGNFTETPKVVHPTKTGVNLLGKLPDGSYAQKYYYGEWSDWGTLSYGYKSEPAFINKKGQNFFFIFGINEAGSVRLQIWTGSEWLPSWNDTWSIGELSKTSVGSSHNQQMPIARYEF